jgi:PAS domain S-box-containing protein
LDIDAELKSGGERVKLLEERLRLFAQATGSLLYDLDCASGELDWGSSLASFGYPADLSKTDLQWWAERIHPDDSTAPMQDLNSVLSGQESKFVADYRFRLANGSYRYVRDRGCLTRDASGKPLRLVGQMEDVHLHYQMFLHNPQPMWVFDIASLQFLEVNNAAVRIYGYSREEFGHMFLTDIRPPEDKERLIAVVRGTDREHEGERIWRHFTKEGKALWVEVRTQDVEWHGRTARMAIVTDVTKRLDLENELRAHQKIEAAGLIASGLAHDFNNLLTIINGQADRLLLRGKELSEAERASALRMILEAGERSAQWTRRLMDFAKGRKTDRLVVDVAQILAGMEAFLRHAIPPSMELKFVIEVAPAYIEADPAQIEQVLLNLAWNAVAACGLAPARLTVKLTNIVADGASLLRLSVEDDGPGMDSRVASQAFAPLFRGSEHASGAGLGLANVRKIVESMGGKVSLTTAPGHGAHFDLDFPCAPEAEARTREVVASRILLVDDDDQLRATLRQALTKAGHSVTEAADGMGGMRPLSKEPIDLVITDIVMPEREGLELIQQIRATRSDLPIIAISGAFEGQFLQLAQAFGATAVLQKPLRPERLLSTMQTIMVRRGEAAKALS